MSGPSEGFTFASVKCLSSQKTGTVFNMNRSDWEFLSHKCKPQIRVMAGLCYELLKKAFFLLRIQMEINCLSSPSQQLDSFQDLPITENRVLGVSFQFPALCGAVCAAGTSSPVPRCLYLHDKLWATGVNNLFPSTSSSPAATHLPPPHHSGFPFPFHFSC